MTTPTQKLDRNTISIDKNTISVEKNTTSNNNSTKIDNLHKQLIEIQQSSQDMPTLINSKLDVSQGLSLLEVFLMVSIGALIISKALPIIKAPKLIYDSITYIKDSELKTRIEIKEILLKIMGLTTSDRVILALFHNGEEDAAGIHLRKFTAIAEVHERLPPIKNNLRGVPISNIEDELEYCALANKDWVFIDTNDPNLSNLCIAYMDRNGLKAKYSYILKNKKGFYGIINIHYVEDTVDFINNLDPDNITRQKRIRYLTNELEKKIGELKNDTKWWQKVLKFFKNFAANT